MMAGHPDAEGGSARGWKATDGATQIPAADSGRGSRLWPGIIIVGMALVILVNGLFIYIAVKGADAVVPSYNTEER